MPDVDVDVDVEGAPSQGGDPVEPAGARFDVLVEVRLRPGIADPQGATVERALPTLGFSSVGRVRVGKAVRFTVEAADEAAARQVAGLLSTSLLSNPVIEDAEILSCRPASAEAVSDTRPAGAGGGR